MNNKQTLEKQFKSRLADKQIKITNDEAKIMTNEFIEAMLDCITDSGLQIVGLGTWAHQDKEARVARNPKTGEAVNVDAKTVVKYKIAKSLKDVK